MIREVNALDGRSWTVRSEVNWRTPEVLRQFEHDVAGGKTAGVALLLGVVMVLLVLVFGAPDAVYFPYWLKLIFLALLMVLPAHWLVNRTWTIVAETREPLFTSGEYWEGTVRGISAARYEVSRTVHNLQEYSRPDDGRGMLQPFS